MEVKILQESLPIIQINFEEMKTALTETLEGYRNIVVTEETLKVCKESQKELASTRVTLDNYRKDKKKTLSKPITEFENQCKELIALVEEAEQPIKDGIKVFDDLKREEKHNVALRIIQEVVQEQELNEKYASQLIIIDKYCNLTAKESEVKEDLTSKAMTLKVEQDREAELIEIIKDAIESENERINSKMKFEDFKRYIDRNMSAKDVIAEIKLRAANIYRAENPPKIEPIIEIIPEPIFEIVPEPIFEPIEKEIIEPKYYANYKITGELRQLRGVSDYLKANNISYEVGEQGKI